MKKSFLLRFSTFFLGCAALGGCVAGGSGPSLEEQVQQQDMQLRQLQAEKADAWNQMQAMRQELNDMKHNMAEMKRASGQDPADPLQAADPSAPAHQPAGAQTPEGVQPWGAQPQQPAAPAGAQPQAQGQPAPAHQPSTPGPVQAPSESTWGKANPDEQPVAAPAAQKDLAQALYDSGQNAFAARKYAEAQRSFSDFTKNYSSHKLMPDAQFYLAECYFQSNQFSDAALAYNEIITKYAKSARAPAAYLKQGICFSKSGQKAAAKARMQELIRKYPNSPEAGRAKAFLKTNA